MSDREPPDLDALARRFLALWQDQARAMAADPATLEAMRAGADAWAPLMGAWAQALKAGADNAAAPARAAGQAGSAPAGPASSDRDEFLHDLDRRLRGVEERLAKLEGAAETRKRKPKPAD